MQKILIVKSPSSAAVQSEAVAVTPCDRTFSVGAEQEGHSITMHRGEAGGRGLPKPLVYVGGMPTMATALAPCEPLAKLISDTF